MGKTRAPRRVTQASAVPDRLDDAFNRNDLYPKVMVVHLTSVRRAGGGYPWEVDLPRGAAALGVASVAKCGEVYTLLKSHLDVLSGTLGNEHMGRVDRALALALGLG